MVIPIRIRRKSWQGIITFLKLTEAGIQKKFSYGIKFQNIDDHSAAFKFLSSLDRMFELRKSGDHDYRVYTYAEGKKVEVKSLFIHFEDDSFWFPEISRIELVGIDVAQGGLITESIIP